MHARHSTEPSIAGSPAQPPVFAPRSGATPTDSSKAEPPRVLGGLKRSFTGGPVEEPPTVDKPPVPIDEPPGGEEPPTEEPPPDVDDGDDAVKDPPVPGQPKEKRV
jgi:hypothetical protein